MNEKHNKDEKDYNKEEYLTNKGFSECQKCEKLFKNPDGNPTCDRCWKEALMDD